MNHIVSMPLYQIVLCCMGGTFIANTIWVVGAAIFKKKTEQP